MFEYVKHVSQFSIIARKSNRKKVNMEEDILKDLLQDYFKDNFNIVSYVKKGNECTANINCNIFSLSDVDRFIKFYTKETNETLKLKFRKKETEKSIYKIKNIYRCHHDTLNERARDNRTVLEQNPFKRFRNASYSFQVTFKILKVATNGFTCNILLEHRHNHPINSLEALSFKMLSEEVRKEVNSVFLNNLTPSQAHNKFLLNLKKKIARMT